MGINCNSDMKDNIQKVLSEVLKRAFVITDDRNFRLEVNSKDNDTITIQAVQGTKELLAVTVDMKDIDCPKPLVKQSEGISLFANCLMDTFWRRYWDASDYGSQNFGQIDEYIYKTYHNGCEEFRDRIKYNYQIDLEIIQNISSLPYERKECQGWFFFLFHLI